MRLPAFGVIARMLIFPGINLHARERYRYLPARFGAEVSRGRHVLDVGCGNGMLSYRAWQRGATVIGLTIKESERKGCEELFNRHKGIPREELSFRCLRLADWEDGEGRYDAVVCADVLEHIRDDAGACRKVWHLLKPGGRFHITVPNAMHPYNAAFPLDTAEDGGHVRPGYTEGSLRSLLEPLGFLVEAVEGFGGPIRQAFNRRIKEVQERFGPAAGLPLFLLALPFLPFDQVHPVTPYSLYARCRKPA